MCVRTVILKGPDSGSTWFVNELTGNVGNAAAAVHAARRVSLRKEPITKREYPGGLNATRLQAILANLLAQPCDERTMIAGFSQNPELDIFSRLSGDQNFMTELQAYQSTVRFVTWIRSNVVSRSFSFMRKGAVCHVANLSPRSSPSLLNRCQSATYSVEKALLKESLKSMACGSTRLEYMWGRRLRSHRILYEEFVVNRTKVLKGLFRSAPAHPRLYYAHPPHVSPFSDL